MNMINKLKRQFERGILPSNSSDEESEDEESASRFIGIDLPKFETPLSHRFLGHHNASLCQELFDIAITQRQAKIHPDRVTDNFRRE